MVKNTTGGGRAKGLARKNEREQYTRLRMSECDEEKYAIVRKILGGTRCEVFCSDSVTRQAIIRGKFTGKNKRKNVICSGCIMLVGIRDWVTKKEGKIEECDVLEVYSALEIDQLKQRPNFPTEFLDSSMREMFGDSKAAGKTDEFIFTMEELANDIPLTGTSSTEAEALMDTGEEINIDDI